MTGYLSAPGLLLVFTDALEPIMAVASCGPLVVAGSNHKLGDLKKDGKTNNTAQVVCDAGHFGGTTTAVCSPDGPGKSKWKGHSACQR